MSNFVTQLLISLSSSVLTLTCTKLLPPKYSYLFLLGAGGKPEY